MNKRTMTVLALAMTMGILATTTVQAQMQSPSLDMIAYPEVVTVGEPVTFTITKTNLLPRDADWHVRDFLPAGAEFVSATPSQGECALWGRAELGIPYNPTNGYDSDVVQCDLGTIPSGEAATMEIVVTPTVVGEMTNYAADNGEQLARAMVTVE